MSFRRRFQNLPLLFSPVYTLFFGKKFFANLLIQDPHNLIFDSQLRCGRKSKTHNLRLRVDFNWRAIFSLHSKHFRASSSRNLGREQKGLPAHMCKLRTSANKIEAMHEIWHVSVKVEPRSTSRLSSTLYILPLFYS